MQINGLAALAGSGVTRDYEFSGGFTLTCRKFNLGLYAQREDEIVRLRGNIRKCVNEYEDMVFRSKEMKDAIYNGFEKAIKEIVARPSFSTFDEVMDFEMSNHGKIYTLWLLCNKEGETLDDYTILYNGMSSDDQQLMEEMFDWAAEASYIKN